MALWFILEAREQKVLKDAVKKEAQVMSSYIENDIRDRIPAFERLVTGWEDHRPDYYRQFQSEAEEIIKDYSGTQAIEWIDKNFIVRLIIPMAGNEQALNLNVKKRDYFASYINTKIHERNPIMSPSIDLVQGGKGILLFFPIFVEKEFDGCILVVFKIEKWLDYVFSGIDGKPRTKYKIQVKMDDKPIYTKDNFGEEDYDNYRATSEINIMGHDFSITIIPTKEFIDNRYTYIPEITVIVALLFSTMLVYMVYLFQQASLYAWHNKLEATHDALTNVPSLRLAMDRLVLALENARRKNLTLAVIFLDLDKFKTINDTYGHDAGDKLLIEVADRLTNCVRKVDTVARIGGDEFLIILPEIASRDDAKVVATKITAAITQPIYLKNVNVVITGSIGIAIFPDHTGDAESLIRLADQAMYASKRVKPGSYTFA